MRAALLSCLTLLYLSGTAFAQVPEMGRWQDLDFTADAVQSRTSARYHQILADIAAKGTLDNDAQC